MKDAYGNPLKSGFYIHSNTRIIVYAKKIPKKGFLGDTIIANGLPIDSATANCLCPQDVKTIRKNLEAQLSWLGETKQREGRKLR